MSPERRVRQFSSVQNSTCFLQSIEVSAGTSGKEVNAFFTLLSLLKRRTELRSVWAAKWLVAYSSPAAPPKMFQGPIAGFASARLASVAASENDLERHDTSQPRRTHHQPKARPTLPQLPHLASAYSLCMLPSASQPSCPMLRLPSLSPPTVPRLAEEQLAANTTTKVRTRGTVPPL